MVRIYQGLDPSRYDISPVTYRIDPTAGLAIATLTGNAATLLKPNTVLEFFLVTFINNNTTCGLQGNYAPGLRYYDPSSRSWLIGSPPNVTKTHSLLLLHGILSCVEETFPPGLVERFRADGAYDYIIGYDYDWLANPSTIAPDIAGTINGLGLNKIDIFAHSYGTINAMAIVPALNVSQIDNVVLYDGPLDGAFIGDANVFQSLVTDAEHLSLPQNELFVSAPNLAVPLVTALRNASSIYRTKNNAQLDAIKAAFNNSGKVAHVIKVTGGSPLVIGSSPTSTLANLYTKITGITPLQNDGVVESGSATEAGVHGTQPPMDFGPNDTIDRLDDFRIFPLATHTSILSAGDPVDPNSGTNPNFQALTEQFVSPDLSFEFNNSMDQTGIYPNSGAAVVLKGVKSRAHFYAINSCFFTKFSVAVFGQTPYLDYLPKTSLPIINCGTASPFTFTVAQDTPAPIQVLQNQAVPTTATLFGFTTAFGQEAFLQSDFFILPKCTSCLTSGTAPLDVMRQRLNQGRQAATSAQGVPVLSSKKPQ